MYRILSDIISYVGRKLARLLNQAGHFPFMKMPIYFGTTDICYYPQGLLTFFNVRQVTAFYQKLPR